MSKFFKALEQAKRDRSLGNGAPPEHDPVVESHEPTPQAVEIAVVPPPAAPPAAPPASSRPRKTESAAPPPSVEGLDSVDEHLVSLLTPASFEAEQYRALRHIVEQLRRTANLKVIAVSSPAAGDGKTITAVNLAGALAQAREARVLLVDADLRQPAIDRVLTMSPTPGADLAGAILNPSLGLHQITQPRPPFNLSVICAGEVPPSPYEFLKSPRLDQLMDQAREEYDYIVVDTPPLTPIQDCRLIGRWVDGFFVVVTAHRTPRRLLEEALTTLDHTKILGIVFNEEDRPLLGRYSTYPGMYYPPDSFALNGGQSGVLRRVIGKVGGSLRRGPQAASRIDPQDGRW
jgi:capsular exopolysaccharide synthesis family protein